VVHLLPREAVDLGQGAHHDRRERALGTVHDLERDSAAVRQTRGEDAVGAVLGHQPGDGPHEGGGRAVTTSHHLRVRGHRARDAGLGRVGRLRRRGGDAAERPRQPGDARGEQRGAAAVDGGRLDRHAGELGDRLGDRLLQRVLRVEVGLGVPPGRDARQHHGRVLARAVHPQPRPVAAGPRHRRDELLLHRPGGRAAQRALVQPGRGEDGAGAFDVEVLARVAARGQRQQLAVQVQSGAQHGHRLHGLVRRPGEDRRVGVAGAHRDRTVGGQPHRGPAMPRLHETGTFHLDQHRMGVHHAPNAATCG